MNTHLTSDENLLSDIEQARMTVIASGQEVPSWMDTDRERRAGYYTAQALEVIRQESAHNRKKIEPVVPTDVPVAAITSYLRRDDALVGIIKDRLTPIPLVSHRCIGCGDLVDLCEVDTDGKPTWDYARVAADSANGWEAYHNACNL